MTQVEPGEPLGVILAGGQSRRFGGEPKALAEVGGTAIVERVQGALASAVARVTLITNEPGAFARLRLPSRPDARPGGGPLSGIHAALRWADEEGRPGALCVACDMPFVPAGLLRDLVARAAHADPAVDTSTHNNADGGADDDVRPAAVAPESTGPRGIEPLCAYYAVSCLEVIERRLDANDVELTGLLVEVDAVRVPLTAVREYGDPAAMFLNVNDRDDLERARQLARGSSRRTSS